MPPPPSDYRGGWGNETVVVGNETTVVFHEKIGTHSITVVEAHNVSDFTGWIVRFLLNNGIDQQVSLQNFEAVIGDYMLREFHFYVLDLVDLSVDPRSVQPMLYEFDTESLYYPLLITTPVGGQGKIILFIIAGDKFETGFYPFSKARYYLTADSPLIQFELSKTELSLIDSRIAELLTDRAFLTALTYDGPLERLTKDLMIMRIIGDLNSDGTVDIRDIATAARAFGSNPSNPRWNPSADMNKDNRVDILDILLIARNFLAHGLSQTRNA
jgi:hypothetical protein